MHGATWQGRGCRGLHHLCDPARSLPHLHARRRRMRDGKEAARITGALMSRPGAGREPYRAIYLWDELVDAARKKNGRWPWAPAFAGGDAERDYAVTAS